MTHYLVSGDTKGLSASQILGDRVRGKLGTLIEDIEHDVLAATRKYQGFVIMPDADPLLAVSLLVAKQYRKPEVEGKPVIAVLDEQNQNPYVAMVREFRNRGFVKQPEEQFFSVAPYCG